MKVTWTTHRLIVAALWGLAVSGLVAVSVIALQGQAGTAVIYAFAPGASFGWFLVGPEARG